MPIFIGGEGGIRTHEPREGSPVFKSQDWRTNGPDTHTSASFIGLPENVPERLFPSFRRKCNRSATACSVAPVCVHRLSRQRPQAPRSRPPAPAAPAPPLRAHAAISRSRKPGPPVVACPCVQPARPCAVGRREYLL